MDDRARCALFKDDTRTTVGSMAGSEFGLPHDICVKRFNARGPGDFLLGKLFGSRARRLWQRHVALRAKGLPVPQPEAYLEPTWQQRHGFFISALIEHAEDLGKLYRHGRFSEPDTIAQVLGRTMADWHVAGVTHGDMKWSNILAQRQGAAWTFIFIDLDQARIGRVFSPSGAAKDLVRFYRYSLELGAEDWVTSQFLPAYLAALPEALRGLVDTAAVRSRAWKDWQRKGSRKLTGAPACSPS